MKNLFLFATAIFMSLSVMAQDDTSNEKEISTIFGSNKVAHGGYGAFSFGYGQINQKDALVTGARAGWIVGHSLTMGVGGYGFVTDYSSLSTGKANLSGGYGGLFIEPIILPRFPVHVAFPCFAGVGGAVYTAFDNDWYSDAYETSTFLVIEPGAEIELNVTKFFRLALSGQYRFTSALDLPDTKRYALRGFTGGVTFKFGYF